MNIAKFLGAHFSQNTSGRLRLSFQTPNYGRRWELSPRSYAAPSQWCKSEINLLLVMSPLPINKYKPVMLRVAQGLIWIKVFMNGPSKICGRQPLKHLNWYDMSKKTTSIQIFSRLSSTNFTWSILEYLDPCIFQKSKYLPYDAEYLTDVIFADYSIHIHNILK